MEKTIELFIKADYRSRDIHYHRGETIDVIKERAAFLFRDAPSCFEVFDPESLEQAAEIAAAIPVESEQDRIDRLRANQFWDGAVKANPDKSGAGATQENQS